MARRLATLLTVSLPLLAPGAIPAAPTYAEMTKAVAIAKARIAEYAALAYGVSTGTVSASQAKALRRQVATERPTVLKGRCDGRQAWKVIWPNSTPILVGKASARSRQPSASSTPRDSTRASDPAIIDRGLHGLLSIGHTRTRRDSSRPFTLRATCSDPHWTRGVGTKQQQLSSRGASRCTSTRLGP
jgi:hypothetical protein